MFKDAAAQEKCRDKIRDKGMTVSGWARVNGFKQWTVNNVLYRDHGINNGGRITEEIFSKLEEDGLT
jgi:hypothetical protein